MVAAGPTFPLQPGFRRSQGSSPEQLTPHIIAPHFSWIHRMSLPLSYKLVALFSAECLLVLIACPAMLAWSGVTRRPR